MFLNEKNHSVRAFVLGGGGGGGVKDEEKKGCTKSGKVSTELVIISEKRNSV